ncbi:UPF0538 protein C2orf76 homolog [Haliotis rufescens]|uniref:UPF0538 protein C2orf76 homolog n=1 Tax=Haliotis rufescens TaxID=6454 RepID=UPI00201E88B5|nr:UPF0538 protein C2orf76 homolog [Haliotis rufescens]
MAEETTNVTITVRLVRSFTHRNIKHLVYHNVKLGQTVADFRQMIDKDIPTRQGLPPPFKKFTYDTLKISHKAYGAKTADPIINRNKDAELILLPEKTLSDCGVENETELSYFMMTDYRAYQQDPTTVF